MSPKILVIHNHPLIAESVRRIALSVGAQALACTRLEEAKSLIEQWAPALAICDLTLPGALGDRLPKYARARGVEQVWALAETYKPHAYRRAPARDYGTDRCLALDRIARDLGPCLSATWSETFADGRSDNTQGVMTRLCTEILRCSDRIQSWPLDELRTHFDPWLQERFEKAGQGSLGAQGLQAVEQLFYASGLASLESEAV